MAHVTKNDVKELIRFIKEENAYMIVIGKIIPFYDRMYKTVDIINCIVKISKDNKEKTLYNFFNRVSYFHNWLNIENGSVIDERYGQLNDKWQNKFK